MKKLYQISLSEVHQLVDSYQWMDNPNLTSMYSKDSDEINKHLTKVFANYNKDSILDGDALSQLFFPTDLLSGFNVFISHSGDDKDVVRLFAKYLSTCKIHCFVDWMVWGNLKDLQKMIDKDICLKTDANGEKYYDYHLRNQTTAHTHSMLSMALFDVIDQCDKCLFITSENSTIPNANFSKVQTLSPWIYEEISYMNHLYNNRQKEFSNENLREKVKISHNLDLCNFEILTANNIINSLRMLND